jgi:hypothetical protein
MTSTEGNIDMDRSCIWRLLDVFEIPRYIDEFLIQTNIEYSINFFTFLVLSKFKASKETNEKKLNFNDIIIDNITGRLSNQSFDPKNFTLTFGSTTNKYVLTLPKQKKNSPKSIHLSSKSSSNSSSDVFMLPLEKNGVNPDNKDDFTKLVFKSVYGIMFDQELSDIKYDVVYTIVSPILLMLNFRLDDAVIKAAPPGANMVHFTINHIVKYYIKKMEMSIFLKEPLVSYFMACILAYKVPDIISTTNSETGETEEKVVIETNTYTVTFTKVGPTLVNVEYDHYPINGRYCDPLIIFHHENKYQDFLKSFLFLFSKSWNSNWNHECGFVNFLTKRKRENTNADNSEH